MPEKVLKSENSKKEMFIKTGPSAFESFLENFKKVKKILGQDNDHSNGDHGLG